MRCPTTMHTALSRVNIRLRFALVIKTMMMTSWFEARYGSRKGFMLSKWHQLLYVMGRYHQYEIPWNSVERLVFVCKGNICRSAFAEAVAKAMGVDAISAGIHAIEGASANEDAIKTARKMGYDLSNHHTTPIIYPVLNKRDLLVAMEPWQADLVKRNLARNHYTTLLGMWAKPARPLIYDPFGRSPEYFENCFSYIEKYVHAIADKVHKSN